MSAPLVVLAPLRAEALAVRGRLPGVPVLPAGLGAERARAAARRVAQVPARAVAVAGVCGGVHPALRPGDLVVATELWGEDGSVAPCPAAPFLAAALRRAGVPVTEGPIASFSRLAGPRHRAALAARGVVAVDMESAWLAAGAAGRPFAVLRAVVDPAGRRLADPRTALAGVRALRALRRAAPALLEWAAATGERAVLLAGPRSFCAGVERAIETVERALERRGAPVYVRRQIVHNAHVVHALERRGAVFVEELDEVPAGATVVFSAHGVSPDVRRDAGRRGLDVIDATCPLVGKVHAEARRFAREGRTVVLVGHAGHEEVEGTMGEAPQDTRLVERTHDVEGLRVEDPERVAYLTQTTLSVDDAADVVRALGARFPALVGPPSDDICYATHNRQRALRAVAREADVVLVVGSRSSSNARRLVEVAERAGAPAHLIDHAADVEPSWLAGVRTVGLTAGASTPERLVHEVVAALAALGPVRVCERALDQESIRFGLPKEVR